MTSPIAGIEEKYAREIVHLFHDIPEIQEAILFGSRAKGNYREGSDIDIALKGERLNLEHRRQLQESYEALYLPWKLDLILYESINEPAVKEHIDRVGIALLPP